jgi:hypothetical protein
MVSRHRIATLAAAVMIGGVGIPALAQDTSGSGTTKTPPPAREDRPIVSPPGTLKDVAAPDAEGIRDTLALATEQAINKNGFDNLINRFVDADRNRIKTNNLTQADWDKLNGRIDQLRKDWKTKYNQDFDIDKEEMVFNDQFRIVQDEIREAQPAGARMPGERPAPGTTDRDREGAINTPPRDPGAPDIRPGAESDKVAGGDSNRDPGRNIAKVTFPAMGAMPPMYISMIHEFPDSWKIDVPDTVDGRRLYDNLLTQLTALNEKQANWPADVNEGYRLASHYVMMAVCDTDHTKASDGMDSKSR